MAARRRPGRVGLAWSPPSVDKSGTRFWHPRRITKHYSELPHYIARRTPGRLCGCLCRVGGPGEGGLHGKLRKDAFGVLRGRLERQCISQPRCAGRPRRLATNVLGNQYEPATHAVMGFGQPGQHSTANQMFVWGKCHKCVALTLISRSNRLPRSPTLLKALYCTGSWAGNLPAPSCLGRCALFSAISRPPTRCSAP